MRESAGSNGFWSVGLGLGRAHHSVRAVLGVKMRGAQRLRALPPVPPAKSCIAAFTDQDPWAAIVFYASFLSYGEITGSPETKSPAVISCQKAVALLNSRGFARSLSVFSGFQYVASAFSYFRTVNMPVAR